ncbi:protein shisa-4 isoform X2 [Kogia breviceps]|uniref:protein shisa-4 isoform X2 n=1 Tax=Kogia breviceps TaxID=27615 RepID=UPI0034D337FE
MPPAGLRGAAPLAAIALLVLGAPLALAGEDCLWYLDRNGSWHPGFSCEFFTFCCGTCYQRYCCRDLTLLITERQQKHCLAFSPKTIAGIASAVILFVAVVATTICCFLCSCCYLYRRRQQLQSPFEGQEIPMTGIPVQPVYPYPQDPKAGPAAPQPGFMYPPSGPAPQYPLYPAGPPVYNPAVAGLSCLICRMRCCLRAALRVNRGQEAWSGPPFHLRGASLARCSQLPWSIRGAQGTGHPGPILCLCWARQLPSPPP